MSTVREILTGKEFPEAQEAFKRLREEMRDGGVYFIWAWDNVCSEVKKLTWEELLDEEVEDWDGFFPNAYAPADGTRYVVERNYGEGVGFGDSCALVPIDKVEIVQ